MAMPQEYKPKSHAQALALALLLAVTASTDDKAEEAQTLASNIANQMNDEAQFNAVRDSVSACLAYFTDNAAHLEVGA
jgi:hypothetical protein